MPKIFISYRREDTAGHARHLFDELAERYGEKNIFMDVATLEGGDRWANRIDEEIASCDAFLALIGSNWLDIRDAEGNRRLEEPGDYVRREVASGLGRDTVTIPVLVDGAAMPSEEELPDEIDELARRNAVELSSARWDYEFERLLELLPPPPRRWLIRAAIGLTVVLALSVASFFVWRALHPPPERMTGFFNVGVLDFGERASPDAPVDNWENGSWVADQIYNELKNFKDALAEDSDISGVGEIQRVEALPRGRTDEEEIEEWLINLAQQLNATLLVYGVLDLSEPGPPYWFTPSLYLTQEFSGGEELTGSNRFGEPIRVYQPLDESYQGRLHREQLADKLRDRLQALHLFTLGLAYMQLEKPAQSLDLFDAAGSVKGWGAGKAVLHLFRGSSLLLQDRSTEAGTAYEEALEEGGPDYGRALIGIGNVFHKEGKLERAAEYYRRALAAESSSPLAHIESKATFNLGLTLASRARELDTACDAPEARAALEDVVEAFRASSNNDVLRELAFKAEYQRGLLAQECGDERGEQAEAARAAYEDSLQFLRAAVKLGQPQLIKGSDGLVEEHRWQGGRWLAWRLLGYSQLRLAELGDPNLREDAIASLTKVTERHKKDPENVPEVVASDAYRLLAQAVEAEDPAAARRYREQSKELASEPSSG